jgi:hypothetical protein
MLKTGSLNQLYMSYSQKLHSIPLSEMDIDLITFALDQLSRNAAFATTVKDAKELLHYMADQKREVTNNFRN